VSSGVLSTIFAALVVRAAPNAVFPNRPFTEEMRPLRKSILNAAVLTTGATVFIVALHYSGMFERYSEREAVRQLTAQSELVRQHIERYLEFHSAGIQSLSLASQALPQWNPETLV
jgi:hypothetical protein